ncbi:MAG: CrcB family protein [Pirellulaceae bacterium]
MFLDSAAVAIGGAIGSVLRFLITLAATVTLGLGAVGTLAVNVVGCLCIGCLAEVSILGTTMPERLQLAIRVGLLGGLTTFSTFGYEAVVFSQKAGFSTASIYVLANLVLGLAAVWGGMSIIRVWFSP